jgi:tetratricopeptide (TPR) repeat protein
MNTGTGIVIAGALIAGAIVAVNLNGQSAQETTGDFRDTPSASADASRGASQPTLETAPPGQQLAQTEADLAAARREIERLREQGSEEAPDATAAASAPALVAKQQQRFFELGKKYADGNATEKEVTELLALTKNKVLMARVVGALESKIAENPDDVEVRMQLVEVQSARVHSADSITERAMLRNQVRDQLEEVLTRDTENWDARYMRAVGISHSQRTPQGRAAAIKEFESLIAIQEGRSAEPRFASTYSQLAGVYLAEKDVAKARSALEAGLTRYPQNKELEGMLSGLPAKDE